jgi:hypothetical protein
MIFINYSEINSGRIRSFKFKGMSEGSGQKRKNSLLNVGITFYQNDMKKLSSLFIKAIMVH